MADRVHDDGEMTYLADEYVGEVVLAASACDGQVLTVNGFREDLLRLALAVQIAIRLHRPLASGRHPMCLSCHSTYPCPTRTEMTRRLTTSRPLPCPEVRYGDRPALYGPGRAAVTTGTVPR